MTQRGRPLFPGATSPGPGQFASLSPSGTPADVPVAADGGTAAPAEHTPAVLPGAPRAAGRAALWDWATVRSLRDELSARIAPEYQTYKESAGTEMSAEEAEQRGWEIIQDLVARWAADFSAARQISPTSADETSLAQAVFDLQFAHGRLQPYLDDDAVENILINGCDDVWVDYADQPNRKVAPIAESDEELVELLQMLARRHGAGERSLSKASPTLALRLSDTSRLQALTEVTPRPYVVIRKQRVRDASLEKLVELGTIDASLMHFLKAAMAARKNIMISGTQGVGKTTMLIALAREIDPQERVGTLETEYELFLHEIGHLQQVVPMEAREGNGERVDGRDAGEIELADLIAPSLRMMLRRMIVGEVRSREIVPMLQAMSAGEGGSMCTIHVKRADAVFARIAQLCIQHGGGMTQELAYLTAAMALDFVVHIHMDDRTEHGGTKERFVHQVLEVTGEFSELTGAPSFNRIYSPGPDGRAVPTGIQPACLDDLLQAGFHPEWLSTYQNIGAWTARPNGKVA
ncbi:CpaF family protein [Streptomyces filamentosus]|uniref:ATP/GTP-binding protein n=1 Tax=Streptomyces filamentosus TaxID=67294 RepID=A0A919BTU1_STRFL|nr:CpaF/VirB11 family protein [Streptomyces filamentosus]GHG12651.1 ATP/GTP-binding protein [Streptomyces filamentosus]